MRAPRQSLLLNAAIAVLLGAAAGAYPYAPAFRDAQLSPNQTVDWEDTGVNEQVLQDSANIEQILALTPPSPGASASQWMDFVDELERVEMGDRHGHSGVTTPLLSFYAYIARHHPQTIYALLRQDRIGDRKLDHFIQMGLLEDWPDELANTPSRLLTNRSAVLRLAASRGIEAARERVERAFFELADSEHPASNTKLRLDILRFAMTGMDPARQNEAFEALLDSDFRIDPRDVRVLVAMDRFDRDRLLALIEEHAYDDKSMSSYMTTGALLGEKDYVERMLADLPDNAGEPAHFYCAGCALVLATEGLVGHTAVAAAAEGRLDVRRTPQSPPFILRRLQSAQGGEYVH